MEITVEKFDLINDALVEWKSKHEDRVTSFFETHGHDETKWNDTTIAIYEDYIKEVKRIHKLTSIVWNELYEVAKNSIK